VTAGIALIKLRAMNKTFRPYTLDQHLLLPPDMREWLPEGDLALFISDVVDQLDLSAIYRAYETGDSRGQPPYHPAMMVKVLLYAYCTGLPSSRKIERATYRDVAFRVLAGDQHPDHDSIAEFRKRHLSALAGLFVQGLRLCQAAGLVKLGHVALDGTKVKANASKHKAMSYARMEETERRLEAEVRALLAQAEQVDATEEAQYGRGRRGDELPAELARRESRLAKIRAAKAALEQEAKARATHEAEAARAKLAAREHRVGSAKGRPATVPDPAEARPEPTAQRNFTDPDSRIMVDGATKEFVQAYNAQAAVDGQAQVIVACGVTQDATDVRQFVPMLHQVAAHVGALPTQVTADAGYFSEANLIVPEFAVIDVYVPPDRQPHGREAPVGRNRQGPVSDAMRSKLRTVAGRAIYARRKTLPEPVFGQIKQGRGFRRFWLRGVQKVQGEWAIICLTHNLLKLFQARTAAAPA
jgi:transposase